MLYALRQGMKAKELNDVLVYRKSVRAGEAVSAMLKRSAFCKDLEHRSQLSRSSSRVPAPISEGYGQLTDRHVAVYLGRARGSAFETRTHLLKSLNGQFITETEFFGLDSEYIVIGKMLTRWINYLQRCDWKRRG